MSRQTLADLIDRNDRHVASLPPDHFDAVQEGQRPHVVSLCCSDSRVSQEGMWDVSEPGWLFTPSNIGNLAWDETEPDVVDGSLLYPVRHTDTRTVAVVGHTGCGAVTAAYDAVKTGEYPDAPGIRRRVEPLVPVVERALKGPVDADTDRDRATVVAELVEHNVCEQVAFLADSDEIPPEATSLGFVYDLHGHYGGPRGRVYLVSVDGRTGPATLADWVDGRTDHLLAEV
jgi:carbonic anhydrase